LKPSEDGETKYHIQGDAFEACNELDPDLAIFHPDCTLLTVSGYHWCYRDPAEYPDTLCGPARLAAVERAASDFMKCVNAKAKRVAVENPIGIMSRLYRKPDQIFQPYEFGDDASKKTCLWLKDLPVLLRGRRFPGRLVEVKGKIVERWGNQTDSGRNVLGPSDTRKTERSRTYPGPALAMAEQWG